MNTRVYKNLNKPGYWSIKQNDIVVGHCTSCSLTNVVAKVSAKSHKRIRAAKSREVFAWLEGELMHVEGFISYKGRQAVIADFSFGSRFIAGNDWHHRITFHPFETECRGFHFAESGEPFTAAVNAFFNDQGQVFI